MQPFKTVDYQAAEQNLEQLKTRGKIKPAEYRRLKKGISRIREGQDQGFAYDVDSDKGTFTAKNESGQDARGKSGGISGLNIIEGRKTSKALGYLSKFKSDPNQKNIPDKVHVAGPSKAVSAVKKPGISKTNPAVKTTEIKFPEVNQERMDAISDPIQQTLDQKFSPEKTAEEKKAYGFKPIFHDTANPKNTEKPAEKRSFTLDDALMASSKRNSYSRTEYLDYLRPDALTESPQNELRFRVTETSKNPAATYFKRQWPIKQTPVSSQQITSRLNGEPEPIQPKRRDAEALEKVQLEANQKIEELQQRANRAIQSGDMIMARAYQDRIKNISKNAGIKQTEQTVTGSDAYREKLEIQLKSARDRGDFRQVNQLKEALEAIPQKSNGGTIPMAQSGFKIQPFKQRQFGNDFISPPTAGAGNFKANRGVNNRFLTDPTPTFQKPASSYLNKPATQSWSGYRPKPFAVPELSFGQPSAPANAGGQNLVEYDGSMPEQNRSARKIDKFGAINTALGAYGLGTVLASKEPNAKPTPEFRDKRRPYSGDQEQLDLTLGGIDSASYGAVNDIQRNAGNSVTSYLTGRSMVQSNTNQAKANAYGVDGQIRRESRDNFDRQASRENEINFNNRVGDQKDQEARDYDRHLASLNTGQATMQQSLAYSNAKDADLKTKEVELKQVEERMKSVKDAGRYQILYAAIARGGIESLTPELKVAYSELMGAPLAKNGMKISYFKKGGRIDFTPDKILAEANKDLKTVIRSYSKFVADASGEDMRDFQRYIRQINKINRVNIKRS